jgi:TetR/AcrR family transcriptional repressor of nem operon
MGRNKEFDPAVVVDMAARVFAEDGYEGSSMDRLVRVTGVHRGSLYATFGSKRGLFVESLKAALARGLPDDLFLVALMELSHRDPEVRSICVSAVHALGDEPQRRIGSAILRRAQVPTKHASSKSEE